MTARNSFLNPVYQLQDVLRQASVLRASHLMAFTTTDSFFRKPEAALE